MKLSLCILLFTLPLLSAQVVRADDFELCFEQHLIELLDDTSYTVRDPSYPGLVANGELTDGRLLLSFVMVREQDGARSPRLRGSEQFDKIMAHFGDRVKIIGGSWTFGTNLQTFNELTAQGMDLKSAALSTWTGKNAQRHGFTDVVIESIHGTPGHYHPVKVRFEKPSQK
ncbi:MAG: hypothetical protein ACJ763_12670 [Bdellovibrionia bacterium]